MGKYTPIDKFVKSVYDTSTDILIWESILEKVVEDYQSEGFAERDLLTSIFVIYDISKTSVNDSLKTYQGTSVRITTKNLGEQKKSFFRWVINSSILKIYNSFEILIQEVVAEEYLNRQITSFGKRDVSAVGDEIKHFFTNNNLGKPDKTNNRHFIKYLKCKSNSVEEFLQKPVRINLKSNWENFFELISILRNVIAHNGMMIEKDTLNEIKKTAKDIFEQYFEVKTRIDDLVLLDPKQAQIHSFINLINECAVNLVKFVKNEDDLEFCSFR